MRRPFRLSSGRRPKRQEESSVRDEVMDYLDRRKDCYPILIRNVAPYTNGHFTRTPKGFKRGVSDIICQTWVTDTESSRPYVPQTLYIEVKRPARKKTLALPRLSEGKQSFWQKSFQREIESHGGIYILAHKLEDVKEVFE